MTALWTAALLLLPLAYTGAALAVVNANRNTSRAPIVLTQREAGAPFANEENSATRLRLGWQPEPVGVRWWFDREKLQEIGFDTSVDPKDEHADRHYRRMLPREAFVAFEYDGPAWDAWLAARESNEPAGMRRPEGNLRDYASRLVAVDAARDAATLAVRYPDGRTHLITAAVVRPERVGSTSEQPYLAGIILAIAPSQIYVPRDLARRLPQRERTPSAGLPPAYTVTVAYGARWEPFVTAVNPGAASR